MDFAQVIEYSHDILRVEGKTPKTLKASNFGAYAKEVAEIAKEFSPAQRIARPWLLEWAEAWRRLYDNFDKIVKADPMVLYQPINKAAKQFHESRAFIRYFRAGNRSGKSQTAYAEHYYVTTGQGQWRYYPPPPNSTFIISLGFTTYAQTVFVKKMFQSEEDNPLSPMFPVGGKWFYHWHDRNHVLTIACPDCANKGKGGSCKHPKSSIKLYSAEAGPGIIEGFVGRLGHIDEHVPEEFLPAVKQRLQSASHSSLIVTGTPLHGLDSWETRKLAMLAEGDPAENKINPENPLSPPYVSLHQVSQFDAGIVPAWKVRASMQGMDEFEIESRIYGRPAPLAKNPVFDRKLLGDWSKKTKAPVRGDLHLLDLKSPWKIVELAYAKELQYIKAEKGALRIWENPVEGGQYIIGADSAAGLAAGDGRSRAGDPSCASVLRLTPKENGLVQLDLVAQYHSWVNVLDYADELKKLGIFYNDAMVVIELTGGHGRATMLRLRRELYYWNLFLDTNAPEVAEPGLAGRLGVETNSTTKPMMVGALQQLIKNEQIVIHCSETLKELSAFEQEKSEKGFTVHYRGAGGSHDDRVMSLVIATYVALTFPVFQFNLSAAKIMPKAKGEMADLMDAIKQNEDQNPFL